MEKMTKKEMYSLIAELCADNADVVAFCESEVAKLDAKAVKANARAEIKKAEGNEFYHSVMDVVGSNAMTRDAIFEAYGDESGEVTLGKIQAALNWGVKQGILSKETAKVDGKSKTMYCSVEA